jgi:hypothetical protein
MHKQGSFLTGKGLKMSCSTSVGNHNLTDKICPLQNWYFTPVCLVICMLIMWIAQLYLCLFIVIYVHRNNISGLKARKNSEKPMALHLHIFEANSNHVQGHLILILA